jgi:hypothetical protein
MPATATNATRLGSPFGVYPTGDSFDTYTTTIENTYSIGYARFEPYGSLSIGIRNLAGTNTIYNGDRMTADSTADLSCRLTPADVAGTSYFPKLGVVACGTNQGSFSQGQVCGYLYRDLQPTDVDMHMVHRFSERPNATNLVRGFCYGLAARISGSVTGSGSSTRLGTVSGYYMVFIATAAGGTSSPSIIRYLLVKAVAGTCTAVAEYNPFPTFSPQWAGLFATAKEPRTMRMTCRTVAGNVELKGYITQTVAGQAVETEILSYTDSSSPITAAGRVGILLSGENSANTSETGLWMHHICDEWSVRNYGSPSYLLLENWDRLWIRGGRELATAGVLSPVVHSLTAHSLMSGWSGDLWAYQSAGTVPYELCMRADTANNRIKFQPASNSSTPPPTNAALAYSWRAIKASDPKKQDRQISLTFENLQTTNTRGAGLCLFGSLPATTYQNAFVTQPGCYQVRVEYDGTVPRWDVSLYRTRLAFSQPVLLLKKTGFAGLTLGTAFTLRFSALSLAIPTPQDGYTSLAVYINGVQVTWDVGAGNYLDGGVTPPGAAIDFTVAASGTVVDKKSTRIQSGYGEGFVGYSSTATSGSGVVYFDTFENGAGSGDIDVPERDQATITVPGESDAASGTFSVPYEFGVQEDDRRSVFAHEFDSDHRYVAVRQSRSRGRWRLGNNAALASEVTTLKSFYAARKGAEVPFSWTTPAGEAIVVRFVNDSLSVEQITPSVFRWSAEFEEVLSE